jgi:hypothetical protein
VAVRLLYPIFRQVTAWLGLLAATYNRKRGNPRAPSRGGRVTPPGQQTATVLGRPGGIRGAGSLTVPDLPIASDRHLRYDPAVAPGLGEATLDPAPASPNWRPAHPTRAAPVGAAAGRRELFVGLPANPWRTRRAGLPDRGQYRVVDSQASRHRSRAATGPAGINSCARKPEAFSPPTSSASTPCSCSGCMCCPWWNTRLVAFTSWELPRTQMVPGWPSTHEIF